MVCCALWPSFFQIPLIFDNAMAFDYKAVHFSQDPICLQHGYSEQVTESAHRKSKQIRFTSKHIRFQPNHGVLLWMFLIKWIVQCKEIFPFENANASSTNLKNGSLCGLLSVSPTLLFCFPSILPVPRQQLWSNCGFLMNQKGVWTNLSPRRQKVD